MNNKEREEEYYKEFQKLLDARRAKNPPCIKCQKRNCEGCKHLLIFERKRKNEK